MQGFQSENDRNLHFTKFIDGTETALHRACSKSLPPRSECSIRLQENLSSRDPLVRFAQPTSPMEPAANHKMSSGSLRVTRDYGPL